MLPRLDGDHLGRAGPVSFSRSYIALWKMKREEIGFGELSGDVESFAGVVCVWRC